MGSQGCGSFREGSQGIWSNKRLEITIVENNHRNNSTLQMLNMAMAIPGISLKLRGRFGIVAFATKVW